MKFIRKPVVLTLIIAGVLLVFGGYMLGRSTQHSAAAMAASTAQSNASQISTLQTQKAKLQADANNLQSQLTQARGANNLLQEELVDRPTIIAPGTVKDLDGDEK
jgi:multidrug resistance efflux pump